MAQACGVRKVVKLSPHTEATVTCGLPEGHQDGDTPLALDHVCRQVHENGNVTLVVRWRR